MQKQQIEVESIETTKALEELTKLGEEDAVYKSAGPLLIKTKKNDALKETRGEERTIKYKIDGTRKTRN